nr:hypothetical protein [Holdemanella porci]
MRNNIPVVAIRTFKLIKAKITCVAKKRMQGRALPEASSFRMYSILSKKMFLMG